MTFTFRSKTEKGLELNLTFYIKFNTKWFVDLKHKAINILGKMQRKISIYEAKQSALKLDTKSTTHKREY